MKHVLISTMGLSPGVVSGAYFALEREGYGRMDEVVTITSGAGAAGACEELVRRTLFDADSGLTYRQVRATTKETLGNSQDVERFTAGVERQLRRYFEDGYQIALIVSGGRKSMAAAAALAAQKFAFYQEDGLQRIRLFHVEVDEEIERHGAIASLSAFTPRQQRLYLDPEPGSVTLVELPFVPLRTDVSAYQSRLFEYAAGVYLMENEAYQQLRYGFEPPYLRAEGLGEVDVFAEKAGPASGGHIDRQKLRELIRHHFSREELYDIMFDLELEPDEFGPLGRGGLARELIAYFARRDQIDRLLSKLRQERSEGSWQAVFEERHILLCECKLRLADDPAGKPVTAAEVNRLQNKVKAVDEETGAPVSGWLVSNTPAVEAEAARAAQKSGIRLWQAELPANWRQQGAGSIVKLRPLPAREA